MQTQTFAFLCCVTWLASRGTVAAAPAAGHAADPVQAGNRSFDRVVPLELVEGDAPLAGHGPSKPVEYTVEFSGTLHVWTRVEDGFDTFLRVVDTVGKRRIEDDDSGGKPASYLKVWVEPGMELAVTVAASRPGTQGRAELHLVAAAETEFSRAEALHAEQELEAIEPLRKARDFDSARRRLGELIARIEAAAGSLDSELLFKQVNAANDVANDLEQYALAARATRLLMVQRSRMRPAEQLIVQEAARKHADNLAMLGEWAAAETQYLQVLDVFDRTLPEEDTSKQVTQANLAYLRSKLGDLEGALSLQKRVVQAYARYLNEDEPRLQLARMQLAITLSRLGELHAARTLLEQGLAIAVRSSPASESLVLPLRGELANVLRRSGDLQGARALETEVLEGFQSTLPDDATFLQFARLNLASTLRLLHEYESARALQEAALDVFTATQDEDSLHSARASLALTLHGLGDNAGSDRLQRETLEFLERSRSEDDRELAVLRLHRAHAELCHGSPEAALALAEQALDVMTRTLPAVHPHIQEARAVVALILARPIVGTAPEPSGERRRALEAARGRCLELMRARTAALTRSAREAVLSSSAREAEERCANLGDELGVLLAFAGGEGHFAPLRELDVDAFVLSETTRSAALGAAAVQRLAERMPEYRARRDALRTARRELARKAQSGAPPAELQRAVLACDDLERALVQLAEASPAGVPPGMDLDLEALARRLAPDQALVGVRRYRPVGLESEKLPPGEHRWSAAAQSVHLCAFVLRRAPAGGVPGAGPGARGEFDLTRVALGPLAPIEAAVHAWRTSIGVAFDRGSAVRSAAAADRARQCGEALRELVFDPLLPALGGAKHLVFALDDVLHLVPLDALPARLEPTDAPGSHPLLGERLAIETRCTLAEWLTPATRPSGPTTLLVLGGADFDSEPMALDERDGRPSGASAVAGTPDRPSPRGAALLRGGAWERGFPPLPFGSEEARGIAELFKKRGVAHVLEERTASRAALEAHAPGARWLHVATHGWCTSDSVKSWADVEALDGPRGLKVGTSGEQVVRGMAPMLLCGLALAGANLSEDVLGRPPGLLTAEELSTFDLSSCELAVLSACDTSVGERRAGQGVASLQKALHMAGARTAITSLWEVPDKATKELMLQFYRRIWIGKVPKARALWEAKMWLRNAAGSGGRPQYSTRDWAAWVLTGDPH